MKTIKSVTIMPLFVDTIPDPEHMEEKVFYICQEYRTISHLCLCGCKNEVVTPLTVEGWILTGDVHKISLSPSIGSYNLPCKSHYVIRNNVANFI